MIRTCQIRPVVPSVGGITVAAEAMSGGQARFCLTLLWFRQESTVNAADLVDLRRLIDGVLNDMGETTP